MAKLSLRDRCEGNFTNVGDYHHHTTTLWDKLSAHSRKAVQKARRDAK